MTAYIGPLGRLQRIYSTPGMTVTGIPSRSYATTLEGRVQVQVGQVGRREWGLDARAAEPVDVGVLTGFALGEWGIGPFVWVSPTAPFTNLLTPDVSLCGETAALASAAVSLGGPLTLAGGGVAGRSLSNSNVAANLVFGNVPTPVLPGRGVTASAYLLGLDAQMGVSFWTSNGVYIGAALSSGRGVAGEARRLFVTATPPANAAYCQVYGFKTVRAARPALTWTDELFEWQSGEGCPKAIVDDLSRTVNYAASNLRGRRDSDMSFVIRELG